MRGMKYAFSNADLPAGTAPAGHSRERDTFYWKNQVMP